MNSTTNDGDDSDSCVKDVYDEMSGQVRTRTPFKYRHSEIEDGLIYSYAAEQNKDIILTAITSLQLPAGANLLEIASGTGQHVLHLARALSHVHFQPSEVNAHMTATITKRRLMWLEGGRLPTSNVAPPLRLDVRQTEHWFQATHTAIDAVLCVNLLHVATSDCGIKLLQNSCACLRPLGFLVLYGPFLCDGKVPERLRDVDRKLHTENSDWGLRDVDLLIHQAESCGLDLYHDVRIGSSHRLIIWQKNKKQQ